MAEPAKQTIDAAHASAAPRATVPARPALVLLSPETVVDRELPSLAEAGPARLSVLRRLDPSAQQQALLSLQRIHGNAAVQRLIQTGSLRPMRGPGSSVPEATAGPSDRALQRKRRDSTVTEDPATDQRTGTDHQAAGAANDGRMNGHSPPASAGDTPPGQAHEPPGSAAIADAMPLAPTVRTERAPSPESRRASELPAGSATGSVRSFHGASGSGAPGVVGGPTNRPNGSGPAQEAPGSAEGDRAAVDTSSAEGILESLASGPVSAFGQALGTAKTASAGVQIREKDAAEAVFPSIAQPTGLPPVAESKRVPATTLPQGQPPEVRSAGSRQTPPAETRHPAPSGPLPGSRVSTAASEPAATEDGGGWWSWLTSRVQSFVGTLPTHDPGVSTSAGPRPRVDLTGDADPARSDHHHQASEQEITTNRSHADAATAADFGEQDIHPVIPTGTLPKLRPTHKPAPPIGAGPATLPATPALPPEYRSEFDRNAAPWLHEQVHGQIGQHRQHRAAYDQASREAQDQGRRQIAEETGRTRTEQEGLRQQTRTDVAAERGRWKEENRKIQESFGGKASARRREIDNQIKEKVDTTHREAEDKLKDAETRADTERTKAEAEATEKKRAAESKPKSFWDGVKGAISSVFDGIKAAVNAVFDKLRQAVKGIIEAAKSAVHSLIEAARTAIVGLIQTFGEFVKGLVTVALAAFPEAAAKARAWIDNRVHAATDAVNKAADKLKHAADAILDGVGKAIDTALSALQAAYNAILTGLEAIAKAPFEAMEALAKLVAWLKKNGSFLEGVKKLKENADAVIESMKKSIGAMVAEVPEKANAKLQEIAAQIGGGAVNAAAPGTTAQATPTPAPKPAIQRAPAAAAPATPAKRHVSAGQHLAGIGAALEKGIEHLKGHWWDELKKVGWNLLWPWPAVWGDIKDIWKEIKAGFDAAYHLQVSKAIDSVLTISQKMNSIAGNLYGWFFIASVLVGAVLGGIFGVGAGAVPGALAGAAFAGEVGEGLVAALLVTEAAVIVKSIADLAIGNDSAKEDQEDYGKIGGSTLTIAITLAMMLLGEIAAKLAKSIWEGVSGLFKGEKAPGGDVKVEVDGKAGSDAKTGDTKPTGEGEPGDAKPAEHDLGTENGKKVLAEEPTADGEKVKVTEDGECLVCSDCAKIETKFADELKDPANDALRQELDAAKQMTDPVAKAKAAAAVEDKLARIRRTNSGVKGPLKPADWSAGQPAADVLKGGKQVRGLFPEKALPNEVLYRRSPTTGDVTHYQVYDAQGLPIKRVDLTGAAHGGVPTPHVVEFAENVNPKTGDAFRKSESTVRPAAPNEIP